MMTAEDRAFCELVTVAGSHPVKYNTFEIVERIVSEGIQGDFCEAGTGGGGHIAVMDYALHKHGQSRIIHAFDSFEGICKATEEDDPWTQQEYGMRDATGSLVSSGKLIANAIQFSINMDKWGVRRGVVHPHPGWFQHTLPRFSDEHLPPFDEWAYDYAFLALLRIDVDLVESIDLCMRHLYPMLKTGGYCIFDDYGLDDAPGPWNTQKEFRKWYDGPVTHVEGSPGTVWFKKP
jgi:O-methyltransferase